MNAPEAHARLRAAHQPFGGTARTLVLGDESLEIQGLGEELARLLDRRWGPFIRQESKNTLSNTLLVLAAGPERWLPARAAGGPYRLQPLADRIVVSDHFALCRDGEAGPWRLAVTEPAQEPLERILDNAARIVVAERALARGGFALHAAGVLREGRAFLFAGPSRAGKSTAALLARPAESLGDDFAVVLPSTQGWLSAALPFDNSERIEHRPPQGLFPIAGVFRLYQAQASRIERPAAPLAVASLMSCTAFPWIFPDRAPALLAQVQSFVEDGGFAHLHFTRHAPIWDLIGRELAC